MTVTVKNIIPSKEAEATQTTQYTAVNCRTIIDKFTATNTSAGNESLSVNLVTSGGTPGNDNLIVDARMLAAGDGWVQSAMGAEQVASYEANVATQIENQIDPPIVTPPLPWSE